MMRSKMRKKMRLRIMRLKKKIVVNPLKSLTTELILFKDSKSSILRRAVIKNKRLNYCYKKPDCFQTQLGHKLQ